MTSHRFWLHALSGGLLAQFEWLAIALVAGIGGGDFQQQNPEDRTGRRESRD